MKQRFAVLDGLRGVAALVVVLYHFGGRPWPPHGYLAVDFFFVLSGFVLAHAYGDRLAARQITPQAFLVLRYFRLWPMALLGTVIGVFAWRLHDATNPMTALLGMMMVPAVVGSGSQYYPFNPPHWSLWFELVANYCYALIGPWLSRGRLVTATGVSGVALTAVTIQRHTGEHFDPSRVAFAFLVGVAIERLQLRQRFGPWMATGLAIALVTLCSVPRGPGWTDAAIVLMALPAIVALGAMTEIRGRLASVAAAGGIMSFPLYAIHFPLIQLIRPTPNWSIAPWMASLAGLALLLAWAYDAPVRAMLRRRGSWAHWMERSI